MLLFFFSSVSSSHRRASPIWLDPDSLEAAVLIHFSVNAKGDKYGKINKERI